MAIEMGRKKSEVAAYTYKPMRNTSVNMDFKHELESLKEQLTFNGRIKDTNYDNIVIAGMGGSGMPGRIFHELYSEKPVYLVDDYHIPNFVGPRTLFISVSNSGNTEETISATKQAVEKGAHIVTISKGGELVKYGDEHIILPKKNLQPRSSIGYMLAPFLSSFGICTQKELLGVYKILDELDKDNEECKQYAVEIFKGEKIPVIQGSAPFKTVAYRWKTQFNENAKIFAYANSFPELNHNDTVALTHTYNKKAFFFFAFNPQYERIKKRLALTSELTNTELHVIDAKGKNTIEKLFYLMHYGDYISYHLSKLRGLDAKDISVSLEMKRRLA
jgi:glucose/mannose-6-phosphate isomerase